MRKFLALLVVLGIIGAGIVEWATASWDMPGPPAVNGASETVVMIPPHTRLHDIALTLQTAHVLNYALVFELGLRARQLAGSVKAGEYAIPSRASMAAIAVILVSGKSIEHKLTAAEGLTSRMIAGLVAGDPALAGDPGPQPEEGTLLPETYLFTRGTSRRVLLVRMALAQRKFLAGKWTARKVGLPFDTLNQAVILASIVEKETALPEERRHVAAVFINRLKTGMKLQSDPTIIYGLTQGYPLGHGIRQSELESQTPYNTYVIAGLPPTPICNPGKDSLAAVLDPQTSDDLYFVANGKGGHVFAATVSEHARNVMAWRTLERMKGGLDIAPPPVLVPAPKLRASKPPGRRHRHG